MADELEIRLVGTQQQLLDAYALIGTIYDIVADQGPLDSDKTPGKQLMYLGVMPRADRQAERVDWSDRFGVARTAAQRRLAQWGRERP